MNEALHLRASLQTFIRLFCELTEARKGNMCCFCVHNRMILESANKQKKLRASRERMMDIVSWKLYWRALGRCVSMQQ